VDAHLIIQTLSNYVLGWPLLLLALGASVVCTIVLKGIQFRHFFTAWREVLHPSQKQASSKKADMTPFQAFVNMLSSNLGNGALVGAASAIFAGGPGAVFWILALSLLFMVLRFSEVYLSVRAGRDRDASSSLGGPMLYLRSVPAGKTLAYVYGFFAFIYCLILGDAFQANAMSLSLFTTWNVPVEVTAAALCVFILVIVLGGAQRISKASEAIVPLKMVVFVVSATLVLGYNYQAILGALWLIVASAFTSQAVAGGVVGFSVLQAIRFGMTRSLMGTEAGLGTTAIIFGNTGSTSPVKDGIMSMLGTFITALVSSIMGLCIVASGVWNSGATSSPLVIQSFATVFGPYAGWVVSFLSLSFGLGVLVAFSYVTREVWLFLTGGRWEMVGTLLYSLGAFIGSIVDAKVVFGASDLVIAILFVINLFGILWLLPSIKKDVDFFRV
jgi:AGCS family alanine or glycine:cation symporter